MPSTDSVLDIVFPAFLYLRRAFPRRALFAAFMFAFVIESRGIAAERPDQWIDRREFWVARHPNQVSDAVRLAAVTAYFEFRQQIAAKATHSATLAQTWIPLGPTNGGGRINSIAIDPQRAGSLVVAAAGGGVWRSDDSGASWQPLTDGIPFLSTGAVAIPTSSPQSIYVGTGDGFSGQPGIGFIKSSDRGHTWVLPKTVVATHFLALSVNPMNDADIIAATSRGLLRSTDAGDTWTSAGPLTDAFALARDSQTPTVVYATGSIGGQPIVVKSTDDGVTWSKAGVGTSRVAGLIAIAGAPSDPSRLYTAFCGADSRYHVNRSNDGAVSWTEGGDTHMLNWQCDYNNAITVSPTDANVVFACQQICARTLDGGLTWSIPFASNGSGAIHVDVHAAIYQSGTVFFGTDGGVYKSDDGITAKAANAGLVTDQFYTIAIDPTKASRFIAGAQDNGTLLRIEANQTAFANRFINGGDGFACSINPYDPQTTITSSAGGILDRVRIDPTKDTGTTASGISVASSEEVTPPYSSGLGAQFDTRFVLDSRHPAVIYLRENGRVWRSPDAGDTWFALPMTVQDGSQMPSPISSLASAPSSDAIYLVAGAYIYRSYDHGTTWQKTGISKGGVTLEVDRHDINVLYQVSGRTVWRSSDAGRTWSGSVLPISSVFSGLVVRCDPVNEAVLYCGTDVGVFSSQDRGSTWSQFGDALPATPVMDLAIAEDGSTMRAATYGRGIWELSIRSAPQAPQVAIVAPLNPMRARRGSSVVFLASVTDENVTQTVWNFSDDSTTVQAPGILATVTHAFLKAGSFRVSVTLFSASGSRGFAETAIEVPEDFDDCATPFQLRTQNFSSVAVRVDTSAGTRQASDPFFPYNQFNREGTAWIKFVPSATADYYFSVSNDTTHRLFALKDGSCGAAQDAPPPEMRCSACPNEECSTTVYSSPLCLHLLSGQQIRLLLGQTTVATPLVVGPTVASVSMGTSSGPSVATASLERVGLEYRLLLSGERLGNVSGVALGGVWSKAVTVTGRETGRERSFGVAAQFPSVPPGTLDVVVATSDGVTLLLTNAITAQETGARRRAVKP